MARDIVAYCNGLSKTEFWSLGMGDVQNLLDEALEEVERLRSLAKAMAEELAKWGWGDMHYGPQPQERSVVAVLEEYRRVLQVDGYPIESGGGEVQS